MMQWLDDLDDLIATVALGSETIRNAVLSMLFLSGSLLVQISGVLLALEHPPLALAMALLLFVTLLYRTVTTSPVNTGQPA